MESKVRGQSSAAGICVPKGYQHQISSVQQGYPAY